MPTGIYPRTDEHKKKISLGGIGKHRISPENRARINEGIKNRKIRKQTENTKPKRPKRLKLTKLERRARKTAYNRMWKLRRKGVSGYHTIGEWETLKARYNWTCPGCGQHEPEIRLTKDHIIPTSLGGSDNIENIQPLCRSCNSKKYTRIYSFTPLEA